MGALETLFVFVFGGLSLWALVLASPHLQLRGRK